jgi:hypothetical protein
VPGTPPPFSEESGLLETPCGEALTEGNSITRADPNKHNLGIWDLPDEIFRRGTAARGREEVEENTS